MARCMVFVINNLLCSTVFAHDLIYLFPLIFIINSLQSHFLGGLLSSEQGLWLDPPLYSDPLYLEILILR